MTAGPASSTREGIRGRIDAIEESYEFFLAFAAQGVRDDRENPASGQLRSCLDRTAGAMEGLGADFRALVDAGEVVPRAPALRLADVLERDVQAALAAVDLVRGQTSISSQLVDNLNATIHIRAVLTDLFLIDELLGATQG